MRKRDREIIEIGECIPLDTVLARLKALRNGLSQDAEPEVHVHGDDNFGCRLTVLYSRELTAEEAALEAKYSSD